MDDRAIGLIGLMRRAGAIEIGEDNSGTAVSAGKAKLLLTAADASENALRHAERFTQGRRVITVPLHYTRDELGKALGIGGCSMAAVTDIGFANALMKALSEQKPDMYAQAAETIEQRQAKAHGIRLSGPALGLPKKGETRDKAQDYRDECERVEVERRRNRHRLRSCRQNRSCRRGKRWF